MTILMFNIFMVVGEINEFQDKALITYYTEVMQSIFNKIQNRKIQDELIKMLKN